MAGISFTTSGATPSSQLNIGGGALGGAGGTPISNALNRSLGQGVSFGSGGQVQLTPSQQVQNSTQALVDKYNSQSSTPTTPVKSQTVSHPDGTSVSTTYHPPTNTSSSNPSSTSGVLPPAPVAPIAQSSFQVDPSTLPSLTGGNYGAGTGTQQNTQTSAPTFPGLVGSLANTAQGGSANATNATTGLLQAPAQNAPIGAAGQNIGNEFSADIKKAIAPYIGLAEGQATTGTAPVAQGNELATLAAANELGTQLNNAGNLDLSGNSQALTAQSQGQAGLTNAGSIANTQQQTKQSGLQEAGTLSAPSATAQGQTTFSPLTEQFSGGSYQQNLATVVQAIKSGNMGYTAGVDSLSGLSPTAKADVLAALGPTFDTVSSDANAATRGSNIQTGGTAVTTANATGLGDSIQKETNLNTAVTNAQGLANQVETALNNSGLVLTNLTDANTEINNLQSRLGNSAYTQLNIAVNDARNAYQGILVTAGATPTDAGTAANQNINANMSPNEILAAIDQLNQGLNVRQKAQHQQTQQYQSQLNGSGSSTRSNGGGSYTSSSGTTYTLPY